MSQRRFTRIRASLTILFALVSGVAAAQWPATASVRDDHSGPYNVTILEGGEGITRALTPATASLEANGKWSMTGWVKPARRQSGASVLFAVGADQRDARALMTLDGTLAFYAAGKMIETGVDLAPGRWTAIAATYDGSRVRVFAQGAEAGGGELSIGEAAGHLSVAPVVDLPDMAHFGGQFAQLELHQGTLEARQIRSLAESPPDFDRLVFHEVGGHWPWQVKQWRGLQEPQDPWTLPQGKAAFSKPMARTLDAGRERLREMIPAGANTWTLGRWRLAEAPKVEASPADLSRPDYSDTAWYPATVPGTVLTTLIDRGVYPDYDHGLNNMAIPERLARQEYWYRTSFDAPADLAGRQLTLTFKGINYAAEVWMNGARLGQVRGAFIRGVFDVSTRLAPGKRNVIAVRVSPPPHPGIAHEESIAAGPGENGGWVAIDGPTFAAAEGWDWIPGIRDRNTGLWQAVELKASGRVRILDPQVTTLLPLPATDRADVSLMVPLESSHHAPVEVTLRAQFEGVTLTKITSVNPGRTEIRLTPEEFPQLRVEKPRLWWPNGYGNPDLYHLTLDVLDRGQASDSRSLRFGIRHVTYEFSLFDAEGRLRRVEVDVAKGSARGERLIDNRHEKIKKSPRGWAASLTPAGEKSPAVRELSDPLHYPHLTLRVNGVRILARGGNWGMDDSRKRIQRERLEPYFKLQKEANLNVIRNWMGTNTQDSFYELCDEYGMMVLNDFWASTQDFQVEPQDPQLFLQNAEDTVQRYRNHPSIVLWFGRNEGVPQPILNEGLGEVIARYDGTRHFMGSSNVVNLSGSGPYNYRPPAGYFTDLAPGFSVETGTPSLATLEALEAMIPKEDRWPLSDTIAYHDWHFGGNGDVRTFMDTLARRYGEGTSLADFERKAQLMNYETYRAVFEGLQAHLWTRNSGRLLWMTHPAWPSNHWQIYSHDYDTHASYYGVKKATEPVHAQMNLPDYSLAVVNSTREAHEGLQLAVRVLGLDGRELLAVTRPVDAKANDMTAVPGVSLRPLIEEHGMVIVALRLRDRQGALLSDNTYWQAVDDEAHQKLNGLEPQRLRLSAVGTTSGDERVLTVTLENPGKVPVLSAKLTLVDHMGTRILPARYSDNYLTVLPGEPRRVVISYPSKLGDRASINLRGWNVRPGSVRVRNSGTGATLPPQTWVPPTPAPRAQSGEITLPRR